MQHSMKQFITIKQQARIIVPVYTLYMECCGHAEIVDEESNEKKYKRITMA